MTVLAPHNDDEALFTAYTLLRHRPRVVVVLDCGPERAAESEAACAILGVRVEQWPIPEADPAWSDVILRMETIQGPVWAPWPEPDGHEHHNAVGELAAGVLGPERVTFYTTYTSKRRTDGTPVPYDPGWPDQKLQALGCYTTQQSRIAAHVARGLEEYVI